MKKSYPTAKLMAGFGLATALFWGCMEPASSGKEDETVPVQTADQTTLSLSIKDNAACREQWSAILDARSAGQADTGSEAAFLANCVKEIKPAKDNTLPIIPPGLVPDSASRCHWIVGQIDGGRNELTVTFKKYCPDDCRKLGDKDSARHDKLCRDPHDTIPRPDPRKPILDSLYCDSLYMDLAKLDSNTEAYWKLRKAIDERCGVKPPIHDTGKDSGLCIGLRLKLSMTKPGEPGRAELEKLLRTYCGDTDTVIVHPPKDSLPKDTLPKPPIARCDSLLKKLASLKAGTTEYAHYKEIYGKECASPHDTVVVPPKDTLPKPIIPKVNCDELRAKLAKLDPKSADYARVLAALKAGCPEIKPVVK